MMKKLVLPLLLVGALAACTSPNSVGNLAIGDDSAAINAGRNRAEAQVSRAQLEQHRRQPPILQKNWLWSAKNVKTNTMVFVARWAQLPVA